MKTVTIRLDSLEKVKIPLGFVGENLHRRIIFVCDDAFKEYPNATATITVESPAGVKYPGILVKDGNNVYWDIRDSDVAVDGNGQIQLTFTEGVHVKKEYKTRTFVEKSIVANSPAPDPVEDWVEQANETLEDLAAMDNIAKNAQESDIGKSLSPKTVVDGVVTEWQYTEPSGGTDDYTYLNNKPQIAGVTLSGNKSLTDLGIASTESLGELSGEVTNVKTAIQGIEDDVSELTMETDFIHNELGKAGQFSPETSWFKTYGCSEYSVDSNGVASVLCIGQYGGIQTLNSFHAPANHKIYAFSKLKGTEGARITFAWNGYAVATGTDDFHLASFIETWASDTDVSLMVVDASASDFQTIYAKDCGIIDLTATFGDVVPSKAQLDSFVSQVGFFENYPVGTFLRKFYTDYIKAGANGYPNLGNKTIVIMGDSITQQNSIDGNGNLTKIITNWPDYAMPLLGDPTVYNFAQDGSTYHDWSGSGTYQTFTKQYNLMVSKGINPDIIICAFGTNDYQHTHTDDYASALNVYSLEGLDKTNNYQSVRWAYWTLTQNYPNALIIVSTPIQRADIGVLTTDWIREAIKQMGNLYCINIADALIESGIISQFEKAPGYGAGRYLADGLHPNAAGKKLLGRYWAYKIAQYFSPDKFDKSDVS